jgi:hypothetical protein
MKESGSWKEKDSVDENPLSLLLTECFFFTLLLFSIGMLLQAAPVLATPARCLPESVAFDSSGYSPDASRSDVPLE